MPGPLRLFTAEPLAGQTGWLLPLALLGIVALAWQGRPRPRSDRKVQSLILWGMWLLTMGIFFSVAGFFHEYYLTVMAPAVAALCGAGLVVMWRDYRAGGWRGWLLPASLLLTAAEQIVILSSYPAWGQWMIPLLTIPCLLVAGVLISARLIARRAGEGKTVRVRVLLPVLAAGLVVLALAPTVWAATPILQGTEGDLPLAGPQQGGDLVAPGSGRQGVDPALVRYLEAHQGHAQILVVTDAPNTDALILATNKPVMPLGGFSSYPLTTSEAASLVTSGTARFFLLGRGGGPGNAVSSVEAWVAQHCATVPPKLWQSSPSSASASGDGGQGATVLYDCATRH
jgi:4-amino-4-deoxy-L-arabinose transferase-like glycosyltransferase